MGSLGGSDAGRALRTVMVSDTAAEVVENQVLDSLWRMCSGGGF